MNHNPVRWFEIYVDDMDRAKKFYESLFDVKLEEIPNPNKDKFNTLELWKFPAEINGYGTSGALAKMEGFSAGRNSVLVYFGCDDCSVEEAKAIRFGGKIQKSKVSIGEYGFISLVYDTEGNMIGLHSMI